MKTEADLRFGMELLLPKKQPGNHYFGTPLLSKYRHIYILSIKLYPKWKQAEVSVFSTLANNLGFKKSKCFLEKESFK